MWLDQFVQRTCCLLPQQVPSPLHPITTAGPIPHTAPPHAYSHLFQGRPTTEAAAAARAETQPASAVAVLHPTQQHAPQLPLLLQPLLLGSPQLTHTSRHRTSCHCTHTSRHRRRSCTRQWRGTPPLCRPHCVGLTELLERLAPCHVVLQHLPHIIGRRRLHEHRQDV